MVKVALSKLGGVALVEVGGGMRVLGEMTSALPLIWALILRLLLKPAALSLPAEVLNMLNMMNVVSQRCRSGVSRYVFQLTEAFHRWSEM